MDSFPTWRMINIGTHLTVHELTTALHAIRCRFSPFVQHAFEHLILLEKRIELALVKVTVSQLGFPKGAPVQQIKERARFLGLGMCPAEVGPQLLLQNLSDSHAGILRIGMVPIFAPASYYEFIVSHGVDQDPCLTAISDISISCNPELTFVFVQKNQ